MAETKYLYGAAVQGIQSFIFQTNELKDIIGASELVEKICQDAFKEFSGENEGKLKGKKIINAAGNIKFIFDKKEDCEKAFLCFPKKVMEMAPGITISQAVLEMNDNNFGKAFDDIENKLHIQRNRPARSISLGLMGMCRSRKTGMPAVAIDGDDFLDLATKKKKDFANLANNRLCENCFGIKNSKRMIISIDDITSKNDWIAVIHADGNELGKIIKTIESDADKLHEFSENLNASTVEAAKQAYQVISAKYKDDFDKFIPIRPIVLGGDDFTVICRADFAIEYANEYIKSFENETQKRLFRKLTACAGIAFIKSSYPFYYAYNLAESLCSEAKKDAKMEAHLINGLVPSCLMFHKVQDSFVEDYDQIVQRELTANEGCSFKFGPYYINNKIDGKWTVDDLLEKVKLLDSKEGNAVKSHLRQWMSIMYDNAEYAKQKVSRITVMLSPSSKDLEELVKSVTNDKYHVDGTAVYPVYDMLAVYSIKYQVTKNQVTKEA